MTGNQSSETRVPAGYLTLYQELYLILSGVLATTVWPVTLKPVLRRKIT